MNSDLWTGCYPSNWKGVIVPQAMAHPAKYSSRLIQRIYEHLRDEGWITPGATILDPFGGVALGGLHAMLAGLHWVGVELEPKFYELGNANIAKWQRDFASLPHLGTARLLNGDSRKLLQIIGGADAAISSPPYAGSEVSAGNVGNAMNEQKWGTGKRLKVEEGVAYGTTSGQLGAMKAGGFESAISSPPFLDQQASHDHFVAPHDSTRLMDTGRNAYSAALISPPYSEARIGQESGQGQCGRGDQYGATAGQLGAMKPDGFAAALSSPPYAEALSNPSVIIEHTGNGGPIYPRNYGATAGQLGAMKGDGFTTAVSSPPFQGAHDGLALKDAEKLLASAAMKYGNNRNRLSAEKQEGYGATDGQLAASSDTDFWLASRTIVEQVFAALAPGAHAVWVVKGYVKNKQIVDFPLQWRQLCEAVGFVTLHEHHAMLVKHNGTSYTLDGGKVEHKTEAKSFFRRLAEKNGSPRIDWETVYCMERA